MELIYQRYRSTNCGKRVDLLSRFVVTNWGASGADITFWKEISIVRVSGFDRLAVKISAVVHNFSTITASFTQDLIQILLVPPLPFPAYLCSLACVCKKKKHGTRSDSTSRPYYPVDRGYCWRRRCQRRVVPTDAWVYCVYISQVILNFNLIRRQQQKTISTGTDIFTFRHTRPVQSVSKHADKGQPLCPTSFSVSVSTGFFQNSR